MDCKEKLITKAILDLRKAFSDVCFISLSDVMITPIDPAPWSDDEVLIRVEIRSGYLVFSRVFAEVENIELVSICASFSCNYVVLGCICKIK